MGAESKESLQQLICNQSGDETRDWIWKKEGRCYDLPLVYLHLWPVYPTCFQQMSLELGGGTKESKFGV